MERDGASQAGTEPRAQPEPLALPMKSPSSSGGEETRATHPDSPVCPAETCHWQWERGEEPSVDGVAQQEDPAQRKVQRPLENEGPGFHWEVEANHSQFDVRK